MKKATLIVWVIILGFIALLIFQNQNFFMTAQSLRLSLGVVNEVHTPELPVAVIFLIFFFSGLVIAYFFSLSSRFKARRTVKKLNTAIANHQGEVDKLKSELDTLKGLEAPAQKSAADTKADTDSVIELTGDKLVANTADQEKNPTTDSEDKSSKKKS